MKDDQKNDRNTDEELYTNLIEDSRKEIKDAYSFSDEEQKRIVKIGRNNAKLTNIMVSLAILLLIIPVMTLCTYIYYASGGKANNLIDVAAKTIYVTQPNISVEEMEIEEDIGFFSMHILMDIYKTIGKEDYKAGDYDIYFGLDNPTYAKINYYLDRPLPELPTVETEILSHPEAPIHFNVKEEWDILKELPDGTVSEIYVSLSELMEAEDLMESISSESEVELRWFAVDTGLEEKQMNSEELPISPIGYPAQIDTTTWSPFDGSEQTNEEVFIDILELLKDNEEVAETVAKEKVLEISDRLDYLKKNGIKVYGAVITGPTPELRKLEQMKKIRAMKVGEVKLWNWR